MRGSADSGRTIALRIRWPVCFGPAADGGWLPPGAEEGEGETDSALPFVGEGGADCTCRKQLSAGAVTMKMLLLQMILLLCVHVMQC